MTYSDNGPGFNDKVSIDDTASLGLQLIDSLTEQINGDFRFFSDQGAVYEFSMESK
jgi:two-component sensor histidine kinase